MTLIELLVAILMLSVGILASFTVMARSDTAVGRGQQREQAISFAEQTIESLRRMPYASLGMSSTPAYVADPNSPAHWVDTTTAPCTALLPGYDIEPDYQTGGAALGCEKFFTTGGTLTGTAQTIPSYNGLTGTYFTIVTQHPEACVLVVYCLTPTKRVTVAVWPDARSTSPHKPVVVSSIVGDPNVGPLGLP